MFLADHDSWLRVKCVPGSATFRRKQGQFGLSARLLVLTGLFGMFAEVMIYLPSVATYRINWLDNRTSAAVTAALVLEAAPNGSVSDELAMQILDSVGARMVALKKADTKRLLASSHIPPEVAVTTDIRTISGLDAISEAIATLRAPPGRFIRVVGDAPMHGEFVEIIIDEGPLQRAMYSFSERLLVGSLLISSITAGLVYMALSLVIVGPMRRLTVAMTDFATDPESEARLIRPSGRRDEIGAAECELAILQHQLRDMLQQKSHLAALGLAVSKISHDLRNLLATAQLLSDRLSVSEDPMVQRLAPRLLHTLDRAIAFCQATLAYGQAIEPLLVRRKMLLAPLVADVKELLDPDGDDPLNAPGQQKPVVWQINIAPGLEIDADSDQLSRVLLNLCRNAVQALETRDANETLPPCLMISASRDRDRVIIDVADNGPGISPAVREKLFEAFSGSTRPGGSGLGLAIATDLVRAHGGTLVLVDQDDRAGVTFRITIPDRA